MSSGRRPAAGIALDESPPTRIDRVPLVRFAAALYLGIGVVLWSLAATVQAVRSDSTGASFATRLLTGWSHFDGGWYLTIVRDGYSYVPGQQSSVAFFPGFPLLIRIVRPVFGGDAQVAGIILGAALGALAVALFAWWVSEKLPAPAARVAVLLLALYPYSFYLFGAVYADSLFIVAVIGAFLLLDHGHPVLAGILGIVATADRAVGVALVVGLVVRAIELRSPVPPTDPGRASPRQLLGGLRRARPLDAGVGLSVLGLVAWCVYVGSRFGDPFAWIAVQQAPGWDQGSGPHTWFKIVYFGTLIKGPLENVLILTPQALICATAVVLTVLMRRRLGWGYFSYCVVLLFIVVFGTKDFLGTGRYVMSAFPLYAAGASFLSEPGRRPLRWAVIGVSVIALVIATVFYADGWEVS